ncbi:SGNH/GDSL hydrolase family protein [Aquirufa antheringensis]
MIKSGKKILTILGDSLSMVRFDEDLTLWFTYPYLLMDLLGDSYHIVNRSKRGNTTVIQTNPQYLYDEVETSESNYVIIQIGICDCSPRIILKYERFILKYILNKSVRNYYLKFKSKYRYFFTKYFPKTYVNRTLFESRYRVLLDSILKLSTLEKVIIINIADTNDKNKLRSFGFENNIKDYNNIINNLISNHSKCFLIDLYSYTENNSNFLLDDGIHINKIAHQIIASDIASIVNDN